MNAIQLGVDLATSTSVISAALYFVYNTAKEGTRNRRYSVRKQRIAQMSLLIADLSKILRMGDDILQLRNKMLCGAIKYDETKLDYTDFCVAVDSYIRINNKLLFEVWALESEKKIFNDISEVVLSWNRQYVKALSEEDEENYPDFEILIENLGKKVYELSQLLRKEIEKQV